VSLLYRIKVAPKLKKLTKQTLLLNILRTTKAFLITFLYLDTNLLID
jgi:hypothetical protein